ncbi:MAG: ATP-binding protein [Candidatus Sedimenticola sp. 6PFRAG5]
MKLRTQILLFFFLFALAPLVTAVLINLPLVLEKMELFYHKAHLQNLRADFRDLDQHLASRDEMVRLLAKLPEPGVALGNKESTPEAIDLARAQYSQWINQILQDQLDIVQIVFFDQDGLERFWLDRDITTQLWQPTTTRPAPPPKAFIDAALKSENGRALVSPISLDPDAEDPRRFMTLRLVSPIGGEAKVGAVMISIDVGGMARYYRNTLWVHSDGFFLEHADQAVRKGNAFTSFPGLAAIFDDEKPALWEGDGQQIMWVPMFRTEQAGALWVGRTVDPSPIAEFRNALSLRVLSIVFALMVGVWFASHLIARRAERLSKDLTDGIQRTLETEEPMGFTWKRPQELKQLGENLSRLSAEHSRNTQNLRAHAKELEESNRYKSQFLANVSHELRTPLNSILLLSKMLADEKSGLSSEQQQQAKVINEAGSDLQTLIDNILDLSRIEARRTHFNIETIPLPEMLQDLISLIQPQCDAKGLALELQILDDAPRRIVSDTDKIRQILKNFLANAVKFTDQGKITIALQGIATPNACNCPLRISVRDSGIGIAEEKQEHIFDAFRQADGATNRRYGGTGLGLAISQQLAKLLGGHIELESREHEGSIFHLLLPLKFDDSQVEEGLIDSEENFEEEPQAEAAAAAPELPPKTKARFEGHSILIIDSDMQVLLHMTPLLESWGLRVTAAGDQEEALDAIEDDDSFSVALMDLMVPGLDGCDTIRKIRQIKQHADLPIIALTSDMHSESNQVCLEAGADDFISKPIEPEELKDAINRHLPADPI